MGPVELVRLHSNLMAGAETMLGLQVEGTSTLRPHAGAAAAALPVPQGAAVARSIAA
jgi:hypothetical protein